MYSNEDLEHFYFRYQAEALPHGTSLQAFCLSNNVPYNIFSKWYKDTRRKVVEVQVQGRPSEMDFREESQVRVVADKKVTASSVGEKGACVTFARANQVSATSVRIWLELHLSNGLYLSKKNLSYREPLHMVEKLEGLC